MICRSLNDQMMKSFGQFRIPPAFRGAIYTSLLISSRLKFRSGSSPSSRIDRSRLSLGATSRVFFAGPLGQFLRFSTHLPPNLRPSPRRLRLPAAKSTSLTRFLRLLDRHLALSRRNAKSLPPASYLFRRCVGESSNFSAHDVSRRPVSNVSRFANSGRPSFCKPVFRMRPSSSILNRRIR